MYVFLYFSPEKFPKVRLPETLILLSNLVHLGLNVKYHLELGQVEVLCRLVECLITAIDLQKKGIDIEHKSAVLKHENDADENLSTPYQLTDIPEMSQFFKEQFASVEDFMNTRLSVSLQYNGATEWNQELQVSDC
jgi:hypothetical protein